MRKGQPSPVRSETNEPSETNLDTELAHRVESDAERILPVLDVAMLGDDLKRVDESTRGDDPFGEEVAINADRGEHGSGESERRGGEPEAVSGGRG